MSQPSPPCKLYGEVGLGLLIDIVAWRYFFWPAQNFCAAAEVFAPQNLWKSRNRLCRRYRYMYLGGYRWANKSVGLRTKHHDTDVDHDSTLSADADGQQLHLIPWKFAHCKSFTKSFQSWSFSAWVLSCSVQTNQKKRASACENCKAKRSKSADLCTAMHAPVICMTVGDMPVYMQMNRCQGGKSSRLCRRTGSFPVVTVTNLFANRSTLNSCNFVVSWRIDLKFVALESWRVSFFNNVSFVAKRWGLKNHPRSLSQIYWGHWYPGGQRLKVISFSWSWVKSPSKCFSHAEPTTIIASRDEKRCNASVQWTRLVHSRPLRLTPEVSRMTAFLRCPRSAAWPTWLYSHLQQNSEWQKGRNIGSRKQAPPNSLVSSLVFVDDKG